MKIINRMLFLRIFAISSIHLLMVYANELSDYWKAFNNLKDCLDTLNVTYQLGVKLTGSLVVLPVGEFDKDIVFDDYGRCLGRHNTTLVVYGAYSNNTQVEELTCDTNRCNGIGPHSDPVIPNSGLRRQRFRMLKLIGPGDTIRCSVL